MRSASVAAVALAALAALARAASRTPTPTATRFSFGSTVSPAAGSTTWGVRYHGSYKVVNVTAGGSTFAYVLTQRGYAPPAAPLGVPAGVAPTFVTVPVARAALLSTTQIAWAELLGARSSIVAIAGAGYVSSPCVLDMIASGAVLDVISTADGYSINMTALDLAAPDVVFCTPGYCPGTPEDVAFPDAEETSLMGIADMAAFMSVFLNAEAAARSTVATIATRLGCTKAVVAKARAVAAAAAARAAAPTPTPPPTLWAYNYGGPDGWYLAACPSYQCDAVAAAGGALITPPSAGAGPYGAYTDAQMAALAAGAAVWLYASDNWDAEMAPALAAALANASAAPSVGAVLAGSPAVTGAAPAVFDVTRRGVNSWFEDRPAQPDLLVQDLAAAIVPDAARLAGAFGPGGAGAAPATHARFWWRNVFTEAPLPPATACAAVAAPSALASDACPTVRTPSPLPSHTPARTGSGTGTRSRSHSARATQTASRSAPRTPSPTRSAPATRSGARTPTHTRATRAA